jgi:phosphate transport system substrate-binding protein
MKKLIVFLAITVLLIVSSVSLLAQTQGQENLIRISGANSMSSRVKALVDLYKKANPTVTIEVATGRLVDAGIVAIINGEADLAMASCTIPEKEDNLAVTKGIKLFERQMGFGGIAIIANSSEGIKNLTLGEIKNIFTGQITNWKQVGGSDKPIKVIRTGENHPGTLLFLEKDFMHAPITSQATVVYSFPEVVDYVAATVGSIGFVRIREIAESPIVKSNPGVQVISVGSVKSTLPVYPSREAVADRTYPLLRPYYIVYPEKAKKAVVQFADFLVSQGWGPSW